MFKIVLVHLYFGHLQVSVFNAHLQLHQLVLKTDSPISLVFMGPDVTASFGH